jgi:hypothetical protein
MSSGNSKNKRKAIPSAVRNNVWNVYIGTAEKEGTCFCCKTERISCANFQCGHVESHAEGGEVTIQNLRPVCAQCNQSMGKTNMIDFMKKYGFDQLEVSNKGNNGGNNSSGNSGNSNACNSNAFNSNACNSNVCNSNACNSNFVNGNSTNVNTSYPLSLDAEVTSKNNDDFHEISLDPSPLYPNLKEETTSSYSLNPFTNLLGLFGINRGSKSSKSDEKKENKSSETSSSLCSVPMDGVSHSEKVHHELYNKNNWKADINPSKVHDEVAVKSSSLNQGQNFYRNSPSLNSHRDSPSLSSYRNSPSLSSHRDSPSLNSHRDSHRDSALGTSSTLPSSSSSSSQSSKPVPMDIDQNNEIIYEKVKYLIYLFPKEVLKGILSKKGVACNNILTQDELVEKILKKTRLPMKTLTLFSMGEIKTLAEYMGISVKNKKEDIINFLLNLSLEEIIIIYILNSVNIGQLQQLKEMLGIKSSMISRKMVQLEIKDYFCGMLNDFIEFLRTIDIYTNYVTICCGCVIGYGNWKEITKLKLHYFFNNFVINVCAESTGYCHSCKKDTTIQQTLNQFYNSEEFYILIDRVQK